MDEYEDNLVVENSYLKQTLVLIKNKLKEEQKKFENKKRNIITARRDMYENSAHFSDDFDKLIEMVQYSSPLEVQTYEYKSTVKSIEKHKKFLNSPYFARIDFHEEGCGVENIYIGIGNLTDDKTFETYIYDWRSPIASIFYRYELGEVSYQAPCGTIKGEVSLKRQYEIQRGTLLYFFDSKVSILDDMLKKSLSHNTSSKMKTIVETIQREQDIIIRDIENQLVIVQGVAGSGKTSVALHRIAFLMYQGFNKKIGANNILLISPNYLFGKYISNVLPDLGEEKIATITFENIFDIIFKDSIKISSRNLLIEDIMNLEDVEEKDIVKSMIKFKLSKTFVTLLDRFIDYFEHHMIKFQDIHFNGELVADRHLLKADLLNSKKKYLPVEKRLKLIEARIMCRLHELRKNRLIKIENFVLEHTNHPFDAKAFARLLALKQSAALRKTINNNIKIDYLSLYQNLCIDKALIYSLSKGLDLPSDIEQILDNTRLNLSADKLRYEDGIILMYLKIKMAGCKAFTEIKQIVVDEAQDYYPMHFEILEMLFRNAKYTILGDINQTIEKQANLLIYEEIKSILNKQKTTTIFMTKNFRSSFEINTYSRKFINNDIDIESFDRHGSFPKAVYKSSGDELEDRVINDIYEYQNLGYTSIAIICKTMKLAQQLYSKLDSRITVKLIDEDTLDTMTGVLILPVYMSKGLEFDAVLVYGTDSKKYNTQDDKKLLYIACTRALHKLSLYYTGVISKFLK